ncbi:MAG: phosphoglycerate kinase [Pirellulales bacterium]|nr:phosphoglycerate kinase [Pirellulales bacterium]
MAITPEAMAAWCRTLLGDAGAPQRSLEELVAAAPRLASLADVPSGTPVLVRGDVDAKPGAAIGQGDVRLRSMKETLDFGRQRGWIQVIFGHIGREPEGSLEKVAKRIGEILGCPVAFVPDWLDPATSAVKDEAAQAVRSAAPGDVIVLQNTRKYDIERVLWKAKPADLDRLAGPLATLANEMAEKIAQVYVSEAFSAGNRDTSTSVIPATMRRVALGAYAAAQFEGPLTDCLKTQLVVFSGLKIDKLDNLERMINRGTVRHVLAAGSVATALKKAAAQLDGGDFDLGMSQDPANKDEPYYIPQDRVEQAKRLLRQGREEGIEFVMPVDFVLQDGRVSDGIGPGNQQFDIGPKSSKHYAEAVTRFIQSAQGAAEPAVAFHNGVFGMFEDPRFETGTKTFIPELKRMHDAGVKVYVGGGEGGKALEKYGQEDWVTYNFTAGGTVLAALGGKEIPYLTALAAAAGR